MARRFQFTLSEGPSTEIITNEQRLLAGFEDDFHVNRDDLIAGKTTFREIAEGNVDFLVANPEMSDTWDETEQDGPLPYVDDRDRAVALVLGDLIRRAKNDDCFLYDYARERDLFDEVGEDVEDISLRLAPFEGDWFVIENDRDLSTDARAYDTRAEAVEALRQRADELRDIAAQEEEDENEA